ncbi:hypothetical protein [Marinicella meishanensis]|nr:hypothetical protein [Marinicella sp. NBU2979]
MLGFITLGTNDLDAASRFYDSLFAEINVSQVAQLTTHWAQHTHSRSLP